jgi:hypothetical protein
MYWYFKKKKNKNNYYDKFPDFVIESGFRTNIYNNRSNQK